MKSKLGLGWKSPLTLGNCLIVRDRILESPFVTTKTEVVENEHYSPVEIVEIYGEVWRRVDGYSRTREEDHILRPGDCIKYKESREDGTYTLFVDRFDFESDFAARSLFEFGRYGFNCHSAPGIRYYRLATEEEIAETFRMIERGYRFRNADSSLNILVKELIRKYPKYRKYVNTNEYKGW